MLPAAGQPWPRGRVISGMTRTLALVLGALLALAGGVVARPAYDLAPVDAEAQRIVAAYGLPGGSVRLARGAGVVHRQSYGGYTGNERLAIASASGAAAARRPRVRGAASSSLACSKVTVNSDSSLGRVRESLPRLM